MATLTIPKKIKEELQTTSRKLGVSQEDLVINATLYYSKALKGKLSLMQELDLWEKTNNKDLLKFEKDI